MKYGFCTQTAAAAALWITLAAAPALAGEDAPKAFNCEFKSGSTWTLENGAFKSQPPAPLAFGISNIDLQAQTATLAASGISGNVRIVRALNANHFLEVANEGFLNLTTIYDFDAAAGAYPAVHSRHFGLMGQPIFAQYAGLCTAK